MNAKVTIIVPVYNTANYLQNCIDSIKNINFDSYHVIFIDCSGVQPPLPAPRFYVFLRTNYLKQHDSLCKVSAIFDYKQKISATNEKDELERLKLR